MVELFCPKRILSRQKRGNSKKMAYDIAMHVAGRQTRSNVKKEDIPEEAIAASAWKCLRKKLTLREEDPANEG